MDAPIEKGSTAKNIFRISISVVVAVVAAKIVFIMSWSITFVPAISASSFLSGSIMVVGTISALFAGIFSFIKIEKFLKDEIQSI